MGKSENISHADPALIIEGRKVAVRSFDRAADIGCSQESRSSVIVILPAHIECYIWIGRPCHIINELNICTDRIKLGEIIILNLVKDAL